MKEASPFMNMHAKWVLAKCILGFSFVEINKIYNN